MKLKFFSLLAAVILVFGVSVSNADQPIRAPFIVPVEFDDMGGPDAFGYTWKDSQEPEVDYIFLDTTYGTGTWTQVSGLGDDNFVGPFPIGFSFRYYYYNVNQFWIGSNGYMMFGPPGNMSSPFPTIPLSAAPNNMIAGFGSDLNFAGAGNTGKCYMYTNNADTLIISFYDVPFWFQGSPPYTGSNTFQMVLAASDSSITFNYKDQTGVTSNNDVIAGIEDVAGQVGLTYLLDAYPTSLRSVKFFYPDTTSFQVTDAAVNWVDNPTNGGAFGVENLPYTITTNIGNLGNQNTPTFKTVVRVRQGASTLQTDTLDVPPLTPTQDTTLTVPTAFIPTAAGTYSVTVTNLFNDNVAINNFIEFEFQVLAGDTAAQDMKYDDGTSESSISWSGGDGHVAQYFEPPAYPLTINAIKFFNAVTGPAFDGRILLNDGPNGLPGTEIFSQTVSNPVANSFTTIPVTGVTIDSGGFYVVWTMGGTGIAIGEDISTPISNRSFEGFGNTYSPYRNGAIQDPMIRATVNLPPTVGIVNTSSNVPERYNLNQNYPNPFNPSTKIGFAIPKNGLVKISVYDILGREVSKLVNSNLTAGSYVVDFNGAGLNSGIYFYRIEADGFVETKKMLLIK